MIRLLFTLLALQLCLSPLMAMDADLDLHGDGKFTTVKLPFKYYERKDGDRLSLIHQGGYKVYNIAESQKDVAIIGTLHPCIGIAVTDGKRLVVFHKHCTNSLASMEKILKENLSFADKACLFARIFSARDDVDWKESRRQIFHGGKSHFQEVRRVKDFLEATMGIDRPKIPANLYNLRENDGRITYPDVFPDTYLGRYDRAVDCVAVRLNDLFETTQGKTQIKFSSIDPFTEDVFCMSGTKVCTVEDIEGLQKMFPEKDFSEYFIPYDSLPENHFQRFGEKDGYKTQRALCLQKLQLEENAHYVRFFHKSQDEVFECGAKGYDSLDFYPLP